MSRTHLAYLVALLATLSLLFATGCGIKGPLELPKKSATTTSGALR